MWSRSRNEIMKDEVNYHRIRWQQLTADTEIIQYLEFHTWMLWCQVCMAMQSVCSCAVCVHRWTRDSNVINHQIHKLDPTLELHWYLETFSLEMVSFYCRGQPSFNVTVTITHLIYFLFSDKCCSSWIKWKSFYEIALMFTECADTDVWGWGRCG